MELDKQEMIDVLTTVMPGVAKKVVVQQENSFVFHKGRIITYNDEVCISVPADWGFEGAVQADPLFKLLQRFKGDKVKVVADEGTLKVSCGRSRAGLKMDNEITLPLGEIAMPTKDTDEIPLPEGFFDAARLCLYSVKKGGNKPLLTCVSIQEDTIQSCNNHQLTVVTLPGMSVVNTNPDTPSVNIPGTTVKTLLQYKPTTMYITESWAHFVDDDGRSLSCRLVGGQYPSTAHVIANEDGPEIKMPTDLAGILERAGVFTEKRFNEDESVEVRVAGGRMTVKGSGNAGWYEESARTKSKKTCSFNINPEFLKTVLDISAVATLCERVLVFRAENFVHAISLQLQVEPTEE